jgi:hypothetical protein
LSVLKIGHTSATQNTYYNMHRLAQLQHQQSNAFDALDEVFNGKLPISSKLFTQDLFSKLFLSHLRQYQPKDVTKIQTVNKELDRLLERLRGRTNLSEAVTLNSFLKLSSDAQDILGSMLALETREQFDNFAQIDFNRPYDHEALLAATKRARNWISEGRGRPTKDHLDQFFDGVTELFESIAGADLKVSNHYNKQPKTPFETVLHAGHCVIDANVSYRATVKAYERFKERK